MGNNISPAAAGTGIPVKKLISQLLLVSESILNLASLKQPETIKIKDIIHP